MPSPPHFNLMQCQLCQSQTYIIHVNANHEHLCETCMMGNITQNFSRHEFACKCGCGLDDIDNQIVHRLQVVRDILKTPITINSGCRCKSHNYKVGGKPASLHLEGRAIDWSVENEEKFMLAAKLLSGWSGGFHVYSTFIHIDIGRKRRW